MKDENWYQNLSVGWRTSKTAIAVMVVIALFELTHRGTPMLAALAAVFALRDSHENSLKFSRVRILGNILGALIATSLIYMGLYLSCFQTSWYQILAGGIGILLVIQACNLTHHSESIIASSATFLVIIYNTPLNNVFDYGANRVLDSIIGSIIAVLVNYLLPSPKSNRH
ncbi:FUSC family protein [Vaginisenegalia massiliensis]|uniref:FUSC family protein n=1 Tax=Vaginisenegalia massiliensis TaxID=2058294 RepID=UPI0013DDB2B5|nr:aromatic acid exporter family protein [Vaginisenegalia massiliensis]